jgi:SPX domain protein involved in polyphosphate accumulation
MNQTVFQRYEIKYRISRFQQHQLLQLMRCYMVADEHGKSIIQSLYFDTPDFLLARRSMEHPVYKEKLRLRSYGIPKAGDEVFMELKKKYDGVTYKRRLALPGSQVNAALLRDASLGNSQIGREIDFCRSRYPQLQPALMLSYRREAWYGKEDRELRITFDDTVLWRRENLNLTSGIYGSPLLGTQEVLMEVKVSSAMPTWLVQFLSAHQIYKTSFSKYGTAYQCYQNELTHSRGVLRYA